MSSTMTEKLSQFVHFKAERKFNWINTFARAEKLKFFGMHRLGRRSTSSKRSSARRIQCKS
jgi:hypothetical protein